MKRLCSLLVCASILPMQAMSCELSELLFLNADADAQYAFIQRKTVAALARPLTSTGVLGLSGDRELVWQIREPLKATLVISADGIRQFDRNDMPVDEPGNQMADELAQVFLNLLSGDTDILESGFTHTLSCENDAWLLELEPATATLTGLLSAITISGSERLDKITFTEVRGDHTEISISPLPDNQLTDFGPYLGD